MNRTMHRIFENSNTDWVHFSEYEYRLDSEGEVYIIATQESELKNYVPANIPDLILVDSLNIGKILAEKRDMVTVKSAILDFYRHYGVLGFMMESPLPQEVFTPFGETSNGKIRRLNQFFLDRPPTYDTVFSRSYAEKLDWVTQYFQDLYLHFHACSHIAECLDGDLIVEYARRIRAMQFAGIGYNFYVKAGQPLSLDYNFPSLKSVIDTAYSFAVTAEAMPLKLCKDCDKVFFVNHQRTEFCSTQCRSKHNTRKFRQKGPGET